MKRIIIIIGSGIALLLFCSILALYIWIGSDAKGNINIAKQKYPGTAEEALISFLLDENNSTHDRSHIAIWTLGQIHSKKALPILNTYYKNDPKGKTCYGRHNTVLCQREIHNAIAAIDRGWWFSHSRLNK